MEKQSNKKPLIITLAALLGIIIITVAVTLIMRDRGGATFHGGDVSYPYTWTERGDGKIALTVKTGDVAGAAWSLKSTEGSAVKINVGGTRGGETGITITPDAGGRELATFALMSGEDPFAELTLTIDVNNVNDKLVAVIAGHSERTLQSTVRGGEETGHAFTVRGSDEGLTIFVEDTEGYTERGMVWESESSNSMVAHVSEIEVSDEGVTIQMETRVNGTAEVTVYSVRDGISFVFDIQVAGGEMMLTDSRVETLETEEEDEEEETEEIAAAETATAAESEAQP